MLQTLIQTSKTSSSSESLFCSEASFVTGREFARYENKSHPKQSLYLVVTQRSPEETRLLFTCCKTRYEHHFVDRDVVTVNTNNYVVCLGTFLRGCVSFDSVSRRRSAASLSTSFSCDSLNAFTMIAYPCTCVIGSHVSPVLSYPLQRTLYRFVFTLTSST